MLLERVNKKVIIAVAVLSFSCAAAAAYTAIKDERTTDKLIISESNIDGFVDSMLDMEASLYDIPVFKTQQAKKQLNKFYQQASVTLTAPASLAEADLGQFVLHADKLVQASFPMSRATRSVTESLLQEKGSQTLNTWLLLSTAQLFGVEVSLSLQQDHAHVVLMTEEKSWLEWKVGHLIDLQENTFKVLDGYDLWTAVDLTLVQHYVAAKMQGNDESIEALAQSAVEDGFGVQAVALYEQFLSSRGRTSDLALFTH